MSDTLVIYGDTYSNVAGIKATDSDSNTKTYIRPTGTKSISANGTGIDVTEYASVDVAVSSSPNLESVSKSYTPTETAQSETVTAGSGYDGLSQVSVSVGAISSTYVGSGITRRSSSDLSGSYDEDNFEYDVSVPSGYYQSSAAFAIDGASVVTPATTITANPTITVGNNGLITASVSKTQNVKPTVTISGYVDKDDTYSTTQGTITVSGSNTQQLTARSSSDLTASGATVTAPAGYYSSAASKSVSSGTEGTPSATKGTVSNHSVSVTPSVTNTAGYISGGTKTGTAVTVTASELASGNLSLTANTNSTSCVGYSTVSVAVPIVTYYTSSSNPTSSQGSNNDIWLVTA